MLPEISIIVTEAFSGEARNLALLIKLCVVSWNLCELLCSFVQFTTCTTKDEKNRRLWLKEILLYRKETTAGKENISALPGKEIYGFILTWQTASFHLVVRTSLHTRSVTLEVILNEHPDPRGTMLILARWLAAIHPSCLSLLAGPSLWDCFVGVGRNEVQMFPAYVFILFPILK